MDDGDIPPELRRRPFTWAHAIGVMDPRTLAGPDFVRLARGAHWVADEPASLGRRIQALRLVLPAGAVLAGRAAAYVHGVDVAADEVIELIEERHLRHRPDVRLRRDTLLIGERVGTALGPATSPARTAFDLGRRPPTERAVADVDAVLRVCGISASAVTAVLERHAGVRGIRHARTVLGLADPRAESPRESMLRVRLVQAGLPPPVPQYEVRDARGEFIARLDLAWPELRVAIEYDGALHRDPGRHSRDLHRHNRLRAAGWTVLQIDAAQFARLDTVIAPLAALLAA